MNSPNMENLNKDVDAVLPIMNLILHDALPVELRTMFSEYIFLILYRATNPKTPLGITTAARTVRKMKKLLAEKPAVMDADKNHHLAAIYVRVSSEQEGEKSSPEEQESECRKLAEERGLTVVAAYRDIDKYQVDQKLVIPSGTRSDRPGLLAMLQDAAAGNFGTILATREDRLFQGMQAMQLVMDAIQEYKLDVILAKESFDPKMAPIKAWAAGIELENIRNRNRSGDDIDHVEV